MKKKKKKNTGENENTTGKKEEIKMERQKWRTKHNGQPAISNTTDDAIQPTSGAATTWVSNDPTVGI